VATKKKSPVKAKAKSKSKSLPRLPRLNRKGDGFREHRLDAESVRKEAVKIHLVEEQKVPVEDIEKRMDTLQPLLDELEQEKDSKTTFMSLSEKTFILEAKFVKGMGSKVIARRIGRPQSTVVRFLRNYGSTASMAKLHFQAQAEHLARRITKKADVDQAMEVLDRIDVLPKRQRNNTESAQQFNIIVGMPGQGSIPAPSQKTIEASKVE